MVLYRFLSQFNDKFQSFADNLELNLDSVTLRNAYLSVVLGDFNARSKGRYPLDKTTNSITSQFGLEQLINEPALTTE